MKNLRLNFNTKNILSGLLFTFFLAAFTSCSKKVTFLNSSVVPAAQGYVKVNKDDNKNYVIKIEIKNLAEVNRLQPAKNAYVIWMITDENSTKNMGQIKSGSSMMSSKLKASFETVTAFKPTKVFITAEDDGDVQYPGATVVLSTDRF
jgi:hypothetical protein